MSNTPAPSSPVRRLCALLVALLCLGALVAPVAGLVGCESKPYQKDTNSTNFNYQYNK